MMTYVKECNLTCKDANVHVKGCIYLCCFSWSIQL